MTERRIGQKRRRPHIGMKADEVLKMGGRGRLAATLDPEVIGEDGGRLVVEWHYDDIILEIRWRKGAYRVAAIRDAVAVPEAGQAGEETEERNVLQETQAG